MSEEAAVASRKRSRLGSNRREAARKALAVFVSVVLVVGLMPGTVAWGDSEVKEALSLQASDIQQVDEGELAELVTETAGTTGGYLAAKDRGVHR